MSPRLVLVVCVFVVSLLGFINGYENGAPEETCDSMNPSHEVRESTAEVKPLIEPQAGPPFYSILVDKTQVGPGDEVLVTIVANKLYFEGFLIQARDVQPAASDGGAVKMYGTFTALSNQTKILCKEAAVTHAVHKHFNQVTMRWTAPNVTFKDVRFTATVVKGYSTFFMGVHSETLNSRADMNVQSLALVTCWLCLALAFW